MSPLLYLCFSCRLRFALAHRRTAEREVRSLQFAAPVEDETIVALDRMKKIDPDGLLRRHAVDAATADGGDEPCGGDGGRLALSRGCRCAWQGTLRAPCGWEPRSAAALEALQPSLALARQPPRPDCRASEVVGTA